MTTIDSVKIRPLGDKLLVRRKEAEGKTPGGIYLPDQAKEKPREGEVLAVGPGETTRDGTLVPTGVEVGQTVLFTAYAGSEVPGADNDGLLILSVKDVLAVLD